MELCLGDFSTILINTIVTKNIIMPIEEYTPNSKYPHLRYYRVRVVDPSNPNKKKYIRYLGSSGRSLGEAKMIEVSQAIDSIEMEREGKLNKLEKEIVISGYKRGVGWWDKDQYTPAEKLKYELSQGGEHDIENWVIGEGLTVEEIKKRLEIRDINVSENVIRNTIPEWMWRISEDERKEKSKAKRDATIARRNELIEKGKLTETEIQNKIEIRLRDSDELIEDLRDARDELRKQLLKSDVEKDDAINDAKEYEKRFRDVTKLRR